MACSVMPFHSPPAEGNGGGVKERDRLQPWSRPRANLTWATEGPESCRAQDEVTWRGL